MKSFITKTLTNSHNTIIDRLEIEKVLNDIVGVIEIFSMEIELKDLQHELKISQNLVEELTEEMAVVLKDKISQDGDLDHIRSQAASIREILVQDVSYILTESRQIDKYQRRINELEERVLELVNTDNNHPNHNNHNNLDDYNKYRVENNSTNRSEIKNANITATTNNTNITTESILTTPIQSKGNNNNPVFTYGFNVSYEDPQLAFFIPTTPIVTAITPASIVNKSKLLTDIDDINFLMVTSYLDLSEISNLARTNRQLFIRINGDKLIKMNVIDNKLSNSIAEISNDSISINNRQNNIENNTENNLQNSIHNDNTPANTLSKTTSHSNKIAPSTPIQNGSNNINNSNNTNNTSIATELNDSRTIKTPNGDTRIYGKFSMLLAAADTILPSGLTANVLNAVGVKMNSVVLSPTSSSSSSKGSSSASSGSSSYNSNSSGSSLNGTTSTNSTNSSTKKMNNIPISNSIILSSTQSNTNTNTNAYYNSPYNLNTNASPNQSISSGGLTREIVESLSKKLSGTYVEKYEILYCIVFY